MAELTGVDEAVRQAIGKFSYDLILEFKRTGMLCAKIGDLVGAVCYLDAAQMVNEEIAKRYASFEARPSRDVEELRAIRFLAAAMIGDGE
jgi:hypothetical protein